MADKIVALSRTYEAHGVAFKSVTLREPKLRDHMALGDPAETQLGPNDGMVYIEHFDVISGYLQRLATAPGWESLQDLDLVDSIALKKAVTGFFVEAARRGSPQTSSSGDPAKGSPTPST